MNGKTILVAIGLLLGLHASATTFYVDVNNPAPLAPYTNWPAAATNIQDAIDAATNGDLVLVTNGIYQTGGFPVNGSSLTSRIALTKPLIVQSVHGPAVTVIQGYQVPGTTTGDSAVRCAYLTNGASLVGFTLAGGATRTDQFGQPENVASAILADVEPWLPARRKGRHPSVNTRRIRSRTKPQRFSRTASCRPLRQAGRPPLLFRQALSWNSCRRGWGKHPISEIFRLAYFSTQDPIR